MISSQETYQSKTVKDFSLSENSTVHRVLIFIKVSLHEFEKEYKQSRININLEDEISEQLCLFFNSKAGVQNLLFNFNAKIGVDFTIYVLPFQLGFPSIFMIEAKRLSKAHYDYVTGKNGGIERFKREQFGFGKHLNFAAMIGYVQDCNSEYWISKINGWIDNLIQKPTNNVWSNDDKLSADKLYADFVSKHLRISNTSITLFHFWISVTTEN